MSYGTTTDTQHPETTMNPTHTNHHLDPIPSPRTARMELQTQADVDALGLQMTVEEARLVLAVLSGMIARGRSKTRDKVAQMTSGLVACCLVQSYRDGHPVSAAHPELPRFGWPAGATALRRLGIDHTVIERYWARTRTRSTDACLPLEWVAAFVPAKLWSPVLTLIRWGPAETQRRLEDAVIDLAQHPVAIKTRRRSPDALLSAGTINTRVTGVLQLCDVLLTLRTTALTSASPGLPVELLEPWFFKPARPDLELCGAVWARVETAGPSLEEARALLRRLDEEVTSARPHLRYFRLRRRVLAGLLLAHGQRVDALHALNVDDYRPTHNFGDGIIGPAIAYRPGKTRTADEQHVLALPDELARWVEEWILYTGRTVGQIGSPFWPHRKPKPDQPILRLNASAFARLISGHAARDGTGSTPLLPREQASYHGYNPHAFRHCCYQTMRRAGARAKLTESDSYLEQTSDDFARAVVGHDLIRTVGDVYRDLDQPHLARVAIGYAWLDLRHHEPRVGSSPAAINDGCARVELLTEALAAYARELEAIEERQATINNERTQLDAEGRELAILESNTLVFALARLQHEIANAADRLKKARTDLNEALSAEIEVIERDEQVYRTALTRAQERAALALTVNASGDDTLSVREIADILGTIPQTVNGWIRKGKATTLWSQDSWTIDQRGARALPMRHLDEDSLTPLQRERLFLTRLRHQRLRLAA